MDSFLSANFTKEKIFSHSGKISECKVERVPHLRTVQKVRHDL